MDKEAILEIDGKRHRVTIHEAIEEKPKRWRADRGGLYYVAEVGVAQYTESGTSVDNLNFQTRNYFRTKKEAERELHRIKTVNKIRDRIEELNDGWEVGDGDGYVWYFELTEGGNIDCECYKNLICCPKWMHFKSSAISQTLIEEFGDDLKLLFE
jgi:hypothetical protein